MAVDVSNEAAVAPSHSIEIDHYHPLYLHPSDTSGSFLVSIQLTGPENYAIWSRSMRLALLGKSKVSFVDGKHTREAFLSSLHDLWEKCNAIVLSWIINSIRKELLSSVIYALNASKVWSNLKERFDKVDGSRIHFLHTEIHSMSQGTSTVSDYFSRLRECWDKFDAIMSCPSCNCPESRKYMQHFDYQRLLQFLTGLNESYAPSRSQILMMTPTPTINQAYFMVISEESQRSLGKSVQNLNINEGAAFYTSKGNFKPNSGGSGVQFRPSTGQGHPEHNRSGFYIGSSSNSGPSNSGHGNAANFVNKHENPSDMDGYAVNFSNALGTSSQSSHPSAPYFTPEQYNQILQMIGQNSETSGTALSAGMVNYSNQWIVDARATNHMDLLSGNVKGIANHVQGLYVVDSPYLNAGSVKPECIYTRCHSALVENSKNKLNNLNCCVDNVDFDHKHCIVCPLGKQTRIPFPLSTSQSDACFHIVHGDVWGPYRVPTYDGKSLLKCLGIVHQSFCVYTPQQNGVVERRHGYILDTARAIRFEASVPLRFCGDCRPMQCYVTSLKKSGKFAPRSVPAVFLGYYLTRKGYKMYLLEEKSFTISRDVVFTEDVFFQHLSTTFPPIFSPPLCSTQYRPAESIYVPHDHDSPPHALEVNPSIPPEAALVSVSTSVEPVRKSNRIPKPPIWMKDYIYPTRTNVSCHFPISNYVNYDQISDSYISALAAYSAILEPTSYSEASSDPKWIAAMQSQIAALMDNSTWSIVDLPSGKSPIGCKWVYKIKHKANGEVERYKTRLVAKGFNQKEGLDYTGTFSPISKTVIVQSVVALAAAKKWFIYQMDVHNAFLQGDIFEEVYMTIPQGFGSHRGMIKCIDCTNLFMVLSQFMHKPNQSHMEAALRVVRYVKAEPGFGLLMPSESSGKLVAYCDSYWGGCLEYRRSVTGYTVKFSDALISWKSKKQETVARSSAEAEFRAMASPVAEITWLEGLYKELGVNIKQPIQLFCDSKVAIQIAANPIFHKRTKHIDIDCYL
ncbi:uncharacterized protein LOC107016883 [Solanum pennellii]|uniref:Uncharacterized protein LOC107016883 n=1 Tax=Solanum pennellii TaxID=28526 RepID=A0ABM1GL53_SOLPN|nr:uncharacterized protein LOC107016883 [Solanum pennellii]